jgi:pantoate--beta-alanine ligase
MSSRNSYLSDEERQIAPILYQVLREVAENLRAGERNYKQLEDRATQSLAESRFRPEYFAVRQALNLREPDLNCNAFVVLAAVRLGTARLIDNIVLGGNLNSNELDG